MWLNISKCQFQLKNKIKNSIWAYVSCGQPIPGCVSVEALRMELERRGEEPTGYHNT